VSLTPAAQLLPGIEFDFGAGRALTIPPLAFGALERMRERLNAIPTLQATDPEAQTAIVDAVHAALKRNYPDLTRDEVGDLLDVGNMFDVYTCVMDVGGMKRRQVGAEREAARGNAPAESPSTGAGSSPA
jgi:hypothetical protein